MSIDSAAITAALTGGALIGVSATVLILGIGRIAGIAGIVNGAIDPDTRDRAWRWVFLVGLIAGAWFANAAGLMAPALGAKPGPAFTITAGLLVGYGTRLGGGCTSGHGICGLARLSWRSIIATCTFIATGMATVFVVRHVFGAAS